MSETPDLKKIEQTLKRMTPEQFSALCAELGLVEDLLGKTRDEQIKTLLGLSSSNLNRVARAVRHVWPEAFEPPPVKPRREFKLPIGPVVGFLGLIAIIAAGDLDREQRHQCQLDGDRGLSRHVFARSHASGAHRSAHGDLHAHAHARPHAHADEHARYSRHVDGHLRAHRHAHARPPPARRGQPSHGTRVTRTSTPTPQPTPVVRIVYPAAILNRPASGTTVDSTKAFQMRWIVPGLAELNPDERYRLRLRQDQQVVLDRVTANNWWDWGGAPNGAPGTYNWSVAVVKVDDAGNVVGVISPESERWTITWQ